MRPPRPLMHSIARSCVLLQAFVRHVFSLCYGCLVVLVIIYSIVVLFNNMLWFTV